MIITREVNKNFKDKKALDKISISVNKGSIYGLVGSNGAGKTTLLKILAGIYKQDSGELFIENSYVYENQNVKSKIGYIPDFPHFMNGSKIREMSDFYKDTFDTWNQERYEQLKEIFKLDDNKRIYSLSKGMKKQVAFWLTLCIMPEILILDEPFDGLDPVVRNQIKNLIVQDVASREMSVVISSHNLRELEDLCDHICILHDGKLIVQKEIDDLKQDVNKVQTVLKENEIELDDLKKKFNVLHYEKRGSVELLIIRGNREEIKNYFEKLKPSFLDFLPLTLEEVFIYEMEGLGYDIKKIYF